ncbi:hypothetical protein [Rhodococcus sp. p52]|uniref:hypothetical protein n=1 Tax=Rhodococcus sp. p52 TaxID=935199 RepID=UPI0012F4AC46|nr:hypothetical protein [Rhodococcus sp. p52]
MPLLSTYDRKARLIPGLLGLAPVPITIATLGLRQFPAVTVALALISIAGGGYFLSVLVANFGRRSQTMLWQEWGGRPTTQLLRTRQPADNPMQRDLWRNALSRRTGIRLPAPSEELADPSATDHAIETAIEQVLHYGQDERFPILLSENSQYGLERNLYGFRKAGRLIAVLCIAGLGTALYWANWAPPSAISAGIVANIIVLGIWLFLPSAQRTKEAGFRYATQLLKSVARAEQEERSQPPSSQPSVEGDS